METTRSGSPQESNNNRERALDATGINATNATSQKRSRTDTLEEHPIDQSPDQDRKSARIVDGETPRAPSATSEELASERLGQASDRRLGLKTQPDPVDTRGGSGFRLFDLPREIRDMISREALPQRISGARSVKGQPPELGTLRALCLTNSKVYQEAREAFWKYACFEIEVYWRDRTWGLPLGMQHRASSGESLLNRVQNIAFVIRIPRSRESASRIGESLLRSSIPYIRFALKYASLKSIAIEVEDDHLIACIWRKSYTTEHLKERLLELVRPYYGFRAVQVALRIFSKDALNECLFDELNRLVEQRDDAHRCRDAVHMVTQILREKICSTDVPEVQTPPYEAIWDRIAFTIEESNILKFAGKIRLRALIRARADLGEEGSGVSFHDLVKWLGDLTKSHRYWAAEEWFLNGHSEAELVKLNEELDTHWDLLQRLMTENGDYPKMELSSEEFQGTTMGKKGEIPQA